MTARHLRDALICGAYRGDYRVGAVAATTDDEYEPAVLAPVALAFTEAEVLAYAKFRRLSLDSPERLTANEWDALGQVERAILAAADEIEKEKEA